MARIMYAVQSEGMGHAIRSKVILKELQKNHDLCIVASGRAYDFLKREFDNVHHIHYYHISYRNNAVSRRRTLIENIKKAPKGLPKTMYTLFRLILSWKPNLIISDFEQFSVFVSRFFKIPVIEVENIDTLSRTQIDLERKDILNYFIAKMICKSFTLGVKKFILMSFFFPKMKYPDNTVMVPPLIRPDILASKPRKGKHVLVYQTSKSNLELFEMLKKTSEEYVIYGFNLSKKDKNLTYKKFSEKGMVEDMKSARAVMTNGGFGIITEALYLKKPILSIPVKKQFEQVLNAKYVDKLGYGMFLRDPDMEGIQLFLDSINKYSKRVQTYKHDKNRKLFREINKAIDEITSVS